VLGNDSDPDGDPITAVNPTQPAHGTVVLNSNGSFTYTPAANFNGSDSFTYQASDGKLTSAPATVTLTVLPVNDPPSFTLAGSNITIAASAGAQSVNSWATGISAGPPDESSQTVSFEVSNDTPTAFTSQPAIDGNGTLTFTPDPSASGTTVTVTVVAKDTGGTANGGVDTSGPQSFTITLQ